MPCDEASFSAQLRPGVGQGRLGKAGEACWAGGRGRGCASPASRSERHWISFSGLARGRSVPFRCIVCLTDMHPLKPEVNYF